MGAFLNPEVLVFMIPITAIIGGFVIAALKIMKGQHGSGDGASGASEEDLQLLHEISRGLERMERRIDALETLLADREGTARRDQNGHQSREQ